MIKCQIVVLCFGLFWISSAFSTEGVSGDADSPPLSQIVNVASDQRVLKSLQKSKESEIAAAKWMHIVSPDEENVLGLKELFNFAKSVSGYSPVEINKIQNLNQTLLTQDNELRQAKDLLLVSGGHGAISALYKLKYDDAYIREKVVDPLVKAGVSFKVIVIDACESAGHLSNFRPLLAKDGYFIGNILASTDAFYTIHILNQLVKNHDFAISSLKNPFQKKTDHFPFLDLILYSDHFFPEDVTSWLMKSPLAKSQEKKSLLYINLISNLKRYLKMIKETEESKPVWVDEARNLVRIAEKLSESQPEYLSKELMQKIWKKLDEKVIESGFQSYGDVETFIEKNLTDSVLDPYLQTLIVDLQKTLHFSQQLIWSENDQKAWYDSQISTLGPCIEVMGRSVDQHLSRMVLKSGLSASVFQGKDDFYGEIADVFLSLG